MFPMDKKMKKIVKKCRKIQGIIIQPLLCIYAGITCTKGTLFLKLQEKTNSLMFQRLRKTLR